MQVVIRDIANAKYDDEEQELRRQRIRCIMAVIPNADLIKALCECGKLDPRHAFRNRLKSDIEKILANPLWVQGIDDFSKSNPNFFESNIVEAGKETFELGAHDSPKEVHCLACIVAGQAAPDAPLQCSLVSEDLGDACIQCKLYGDGSCRFLCEECSKKLQDDPDCFADLDDNCTSCVYRQIEDIGPFETSAPMDEDLERECTIAIYTSITLTPPSNTHPKFAVRRHQIAKSFSLVMGQRWLGSPHYRYPVERTSQYCPRLPHGERDSSKRLRLLLVQYHERSVWPRSPTYMEIPTRYRWCRQGQDRFENEVPLRHLRLNVFSDEALEYAQCSSVVECRCARSGC